MSGLKSGYRYVFGKLFKSGAVIKTGIENKSGYRYVSGNRNNTG